MNPDLFNLCDVLRARGIRITLLSTGLLLDRFASEIRDSVDDVIVSLDGPAEIHDRIRGVPGAFSALARGVFAIANVPVSARCVVQRRNCDALLETADTAEALGLLSISFLAADVATPAFEPLIIPLTLGVLIALFAVQRFGTGGVGRWFGPIMLVWFTVILLLGIRQIVQSPQILAALSPLEAIQFCARHGFIAFVALGGVTLAVTGAEALYADMGHFGHKPIRIAWLALVLPSLLVNYYGEGALLLADPSAIENPFFRLAPEWALYPMVVLATVAAVIASQATISGAFSMAQQAALRLLDGAAGRAAGPQPARSHHPHVGQ